MMTFLSSKDQGPFLCMYLTLEHESGVPPPLPEGDVHRVVHADHVQGSEGPHKQWTLHLMRYQSNESKCVSWEKFYLCCSILREFLPSIRGRAMKRIILGVFQKALNNSLLSNNISNHEISAFDVKPSLKLDLLAPENEICWQVRRVKNSFSIGARMVRWFCQTDIVTLGLSEQWSLNNDLIVLSWATLGLRWAITLPV